MNQNKVLNVIIIICILSTIYACHKKYESLTHDNSSSIIENSKIYYSNLVRSEESLLAMPYDQLKKNSNLRRFARIGKIKSLLDWNNAQDFYRNGTAYVIVPLVNNGSHQANPNFESIRCILFFQRDGDKIEMNIIEVYRKKDEINETSLLNSLKIFSENKIFKENSSINGLNASVIFYDQYYYNRSSFIVKNGAWQRAKIIVENTTRSFNRSYISSMSTESETLTKVTKSLNTISPMSGCMVCTSYALIGIWYDIQTGEIVDTEVLDTWEECVDSSYPPNGNAPGTSEIQILPASDTKKIKNNVKDPCISNTLNNIDNALKSFINNTLGNEFIDVPMNFNFDDVLTLNDDVNGRFQSYNLDSNGIKNFYILLNQNTLQYLPNEYVTKTILHEALHGVLLHKGIPWDAVLQHNEMANYYRAVLSSTLSNIYPNLTLDDAEALAWGGLHGSSAWNALTYEKKQAIKNILEKYEERKAGTLCK
jgi:hypothetical protein